MNNIKKTDYEHPEATVIKFNSADVITTSSTYSFTDEGYGDEVNW